jgi:hypothetical protein
MVDPDDTAATACEIVGYILRFGMQVPTATVAARMGDDTDSDATAPTSRERTNA